MRTIITAIIILMSMTAQAQFSAGMSFGVITGKDRQEIDVIPVQNSSYEIYKSVYGLRTNTSPAANVQVGYLFNNGLHLMAGINTSTNNIQSWFNQINAGWQFGGLVNDGQDDRMAAWGVMPYIGYAYRINNTDDGDEGHAFTTGAQLQRWFYSNRQNNRFYLFLSGEYSAKHTTVAFGIKGFLEKKHK